MVRLARSIAVVALPTLIGLATSFIGAGIFPTSTAQAAEVLRVAYAGSMGAVMDRVIGPAFAKANSVEFQGIGQGAYGLARQGLRFGRTDPATDPQGQNIIFTMLLAQNFYKLPGLADRILGGYQNPQQIFTEPSLLSRLEAGQIDASSGYLSAATSHHLPFITLPDEINLSNPEMEAQWYKNVQFSIRLPSGKEATLNTQPLVFYAAVLGDSKQPALAEKFVQFLQSAEGQKLFRDNGYSPPKGGPIQ